MPLSSGRSLLLRISPVMIFTPFDQAASIREGRAIRRAFCRGEGNIRSSIFLSPLLRGHASLLLAEIVSCVYPLTLKSNCIFLGSLSRLKKSGVNSGQFSYFRESLCQLIRHAAERGPLVGRVHTRRWRGPVLSAKQWR